jgi:hypothetical protein
VDGLVRDSVSIHRAARSSLSQDFVDDSVSISRLDWVNSTAASFLQCLFLCDLI